MRTIFIQGTPTMKTENTEDEMFIRLPINIIRVTNNSNAEVCEFKSYADAERHYNVRSRSFRKARKTIVGEVYYKFDGKYTIEVIADNIITDDFKKSVVDYYKSKPMSFSTVSEKFNIPICAVRKILKDCPIYSKVRIFNPNLNESYFENIDTEAKAYFLGLIISDGNVFNPNNITKGKGSMWTSITLDSNDSYILEYFRKEVGLSSVVASDGRGASYVAVRSNKMAKDLEQYHIVPRKSFITQFPFNVPKSMYRHVVRGIFDGDGSINARQRVFKDGRNRFMHKMSFCGSHRLMEELSSLIQEFTNMKTKAKVYDYKKRILSEFGFGSMENMKKFGTWIYKDSTIYLKRKRELFDKFMKHYGFELIK